MIDTDKWIESARVSLDELEKEIKRLGEENKALLKRSATFDEFIDSLDAHNEHEWMLIERIDEIHKRDGEELLSEVKRLRKRSATFDAFIVALIEGLNQIDNGENLKSRTSQSTGQTKTEEN